MIAVRRTSMLDDAGITGLGFPKDRVEAAEESVLFLLLRAQQQRRASAGLMVRALIELNTVETAMMMANWRYICPVMPGRNAAGTNTANRHQRGCDHRPGHLAHGLDRGVPRGHAAIDMRGGGFHDHDGVVHHDADRQHEAEQRHQVEREPDR